MHPDVMLDIRLSATCSRHQFTTDTAPVIAELERMAGAHRDILCAAVGGWVGFYRSRYTRTLCEALLRAFPAAEAYVGSVRPAPAHSTGDYRTR